MKAMRQYVLVFSVVSVGLLSACAKQTAVPIRTVERAAPLTTVEAIPVTSPNQNFDPSVRAVTPEATRQVTDQLLAIVQVCQANAMGVRNQCSMGFAETRAGREVTSQVQAYYLSNSANLAPKVSFDNHCAPGWLATIVSSQGTVQGGGVLQAQAAVCGHPSAGAALSALLSACDAQSQGSCRQSTSIQVAWGFWDGKQMPGSERDLGRPYSADRFADAHLCHSALPIAETGVCPPSAAVPLRLLGLP